MKKELYTEGDIFIVKISEEIKVIGVVAREKQGAVLGYFFRDRGVTPAGDLAKLLVPAAADLVRRFGDLSMIQTEWPVVGRISPWIREEWGPPVFCDIADSKTLLKKLTTIDDDDPAKIIDIQYTRDNIAGWGGGFSGSSALLVHLRRIFGGSLRA